MYLIINKFAFGFEFFQKTIRASRDLKFLCEKNSVFIYVSFKNMSVRRAFKFDEKRSLEIYYSLCNAVKEDVSKQIFI